jgi:uncharacterized protein (TIGR00725 family)
MKLTIGFMGASAIPDQRIEALAKQTGESIARSGAVLVTGATTGLPLAAARGAKAAGGEVIGFSPAPDFLQHKQSGYPVEAHDLIICTGLSSHGRNLLNVRASHGILFVGGSMGAFNEFTIAYDEHKVIGILVGSGGFCDHLQEWMLHLAKPSNRAALIYHQDPEILVMEVWKAIQARKHELGLDT